MTKAAFTKHRIRQRREHGPDKVRELAVPSKETKLEHWKMLRLLYRLDIPMPHATGAIRGKGLLENVRPHRDGQHFYLTDMRGAFGGVDVEKLKRIAKPPVIPEEHEQKVASFITEWATTPIVSGLPLGAPASPFLFNLSCFELDKELGSFCNYNGIAYTRYLDDLTFSSESVIGRGSRRVIRDIVGDTTGIALNHRKTQVYDLGNGPISMTGISIYPDRHFAPTPKLLETASQTYRDIGMRATAGQLIYEDEIGKLHGYHGVVEQLSDPEAMITHRLFREYRTALGALGIEGGGRKVN